MPRLRGSRVRDRLITHGWPGEYGGPPEVLDTTDIPWANTMPAIYEHEDGRWFWTCIPKYLSNPALEDFERLRKHGWKIAVRATQDGRLRVAITEKELTETN